MWAGLSNAKTVLFCRGRLIGAIILMLSCHATAAESPAGHRIIPPNGYLLGPGVAINAARQINGKGEAMAAVVDSPNGPALKLTFPPGKDTESVTLKPAEGYWDLRDYLELRVKVRNDGQAPVTPSAEAASGDGGADNSTVNVAASNPLAPGAETEIVVPFANPKVWTSIGRDIKTTDDDSHESGTGNQFANNAGATVTVSAPGSETTQILTVESIQADRPAYSAPDWLGQRPPVDGDWTKTLDEEFDGPAINEKIWNLCDYNAWDDSTHITRKETSIVDGKAILHYEKKTGYADDDTDKKKLTNYAAGFLDTNQKWRQRYGYWEARMKLPKAPGLWPAFWMMPDRGAAFVPQEKRDDTWNGGMELDIMEYLSGWGPCRYNISLCWDGYDKGAKSTGQELSYAQPDKDGFITSGLLWLPGKAIYYCNGKEIVHFENKRVSTVPAYIIFDIVHGGWDNLPLDDSKLPDDFVIDYVRVWQRKDLATPDDGPKPNKRDPSELKN